METYEMTSFEEIVADEMFPDTSTVYDSENFPVKDRDRASSRRKKTYFKGKQRFDRLSNSKGFSLYKREPVMRGMLRKTNAFVVVNENETTHFGTDRNTVRRRATADDKMTEYGFEDTEKPLIVREA